MQAQREDSLEWSLPGGGGAGSGAVGGRGGDARRLAGAKPGWAAPRSPAPAGSGWRRCPGLMRCVSGEPLPSSSRTGHLHHGLGSSREGSAPLDGCAAFLRVPLRAACLQGKSPRRPGFPGFSSPQLHVQGYGSCRQRATPTRWCRPGFGIGGWACRVARELSSRSADTGPDWVLSSTQAGHISRPR